MSQDVEDCKRLKVYVTDDHVYLLVGKDFASVTGHFENRIRGESTAIEALSREDSEKVNKAIDYIRKTFYADEDKSNE